MAHNAQNIRAVAKHTDTSLVMKTLRVRLFPALTLYMGIGGEGCGYFNINDEVAGSSPAAGFGWCSSVAERETNRTRPFPDAHLVFDGSAPWRRAQLLQARNQLYPLIPGAQPSFLEKEPCD